MKILLLLLFWHLFDLSIQTGNIIFITNNINNNCYNNSGNKCDGSYSNPYDSLFYALYNYQFQDGNTYMIMFLGAQNTDHYLTLYEPPYYDYRSNNTYLDKYKNINLIIKPTFCNDPDFQSYPNTTLNNCIDQDSQSRIIIYLKYMNFSIIVHGSLTIQNLIFDGIDLLYSGSSTCLNQRINCCNDIKADSCNPDPNTLTIDFPISNSTFMSSNILLINSTFQNIVSLQNTSLVAFNQNINLLIYSCQFINIYYPSGIISNILYDNRSSVLNSNITINIITLSNYNFINIINTNSISYEGYLINFINPYNGLLTISNNVFTNLSNSYKNTECPNAPLFPSMNTQEPYMQKSDLQKIVNIYNYSTGVISIASLQGYLTILNNTFNYIIGYSGTVLSILDLKKTSFINITQNTFANNFALINSATIKIFQSSLGSNFANSAYCQQIILNNNTFNNNWGCPGASGNVIIYCDTTLSTNVQVLNPSNTQSSQLKDFYNYFVSNRTTLTINNNIFISNNLIYSNGIIIYGYTGVNILNNTFKNNGFQSQYYPTTKFIYKDFTADLANIWNNYMESFLFQSTTTLFISLCTNLQILNNTFDNNWSMNTTTTLRGSQITIDNNVLIGTSTYIQQNIFQNNYGIPKTIQLVSSNNYGLPIGIPLITLNIANIDNYLQTLSSSTTPNQIMIDSITLSNNTFNYIIPYSFNNIISNNTNDYSSFIRIYDDNDRNIALTEWIYQNTDTKAQLFIQNSNFINNAFLTTISASSYFLIHNKIQNIILLNCTFYNNSLLWLNTTANIGSNQLSSTIACDKSICWYPPTGGQSTSYIFSNSPSLIGVWNNITNQELTSSLTINNCNFTSNMGTILGTSIEPTILMNINISANNFIQNYAYNTNGSILAFNATNIAITLFSNIFNLTYDIDSIMIFSPGPLVYTEDSNQYINNEVERSIKYFNNSISESTQDGNILKFNYITNNSQYKNNTVSTYIIPNFRTVSSVIICIANNTNFTYIENNTTYQSQQAKHSIFLMANQTKFIASGINSTCSNVQPLGFAYINNSYMSIDSSYIISYPYIDSFVWLSDGIVSPYTFHSINSQIVISSIYIGRYFGLINANESSINVTNLTHVSNFTINIPPKIIKVFSYIPVLDLNYSVINISDTVLKFDNIFIRSNYSNTTLDNITTSDSSGNSKIAWNENPYDTMNSIIMISNSNLSDIKINYKLYSCSIIIDKSNIWGQLARSALKLNLNNSNFTFTNNKINNTYGIMSFSTNSIIQISDSEYSIGGINLMINDSSYSFRSINIQNFGINIQALDSTLLIDSSIINQTNNSGGLSMTLNNISFTLNFSQLIDNSGLIMLENSIALFDTITFGCSGPFLNSGGIAMNIDGTMITIINSLMLNNHAVITLASSTIYLKDISIDETLPNGDINTLEDPTVVKQITSKMIFMRCNVTIENIVFRHTYELITANVSNIFIKNSTFLQNMNPTLSNPIIKVMRGKTTCINSIFQNYKINVNILSLINDNNVTIRNSIFTNNTQIKYYTSFLNITSSYDIIVDSILFNNNNLIYSRDVSINLANGDVYVMNSQFLDGNDKSSHHLSFKFHNKNTYIINCTFLGTGQILFLASLSHLEIIDNHIKINESMTNITSSTPNYIYYIENNDFTKIINNTFENTITQNGIFNLNFFIVNEFILQNVTFKNNKALQGSAINANFLGNQSKMLINNTYFVNNQANLVNDTSILKTSPGYGGAIFYNCFASMFCNLTITNTTFENNSADMIAGAIYSTNFPPFFDINTLIFKNNTAPIAPDVATKAVQFMVIQSEKTPNISCQLDWQSIYFPQNSNSSRIQRLAQENLSNSPSITFDNMLSGGINANFLKIYTLDIYGQLAALDDTTEVRISFDNLQFDPSTYDSTKFNIKPITNVTLMRMKNGKFSYDNVYFSFWPGSNATVHIDVNGLNDLPDYITTRMDPAILNSISQTINIILQFRNCIMGEIHMDDGTCIACGKGYYSLVLENNTQIPCSQCAFGISYCFGLDKVGPRPGYWRKNKTSNLVLKCPQPFACLGCPINESLYVPEGNCAINRTGNLCNKCPDNSVLYGNMCIDCINNTWYYLRFILMIILNALLVFFAAKSTLDSLKSPPDRSAKEASYDELILASTMKILTNFFQMFSIIRLFDINWPNMISILSETNESISGSSNKYFTPDCFLIFLFPNLGENLVYLKFLIIFLMPIVFSLLAILIWVVVYLKKKLKIFNNDEFKTDLVTTLIVLNFNLQPNLIYISLILFQCQNLYRDDHQEYYLTSNYDILCYTSDYVIKTLVLSIPNIILWIILFPTWISLYLRKNKANLDSIQIKSKLSFIYQSYAENKYYWEQVILMRKILFLFIFVFLQLISLKFQIWCLVLVSFLALITHMKNYPMIDYRLNKLEEQSNITLTIITMACLYYIMDASVLFIDIFIFALCAVAILVFLLKWAKVFLALQWKKYKSHSMVMKVLSKCGSQKKKKSQKYNHHQLKNGTAVTIEEMAIPYSPTTNNFDLLSPKNDIPINTEVPKASSEEQNNEPNDKNNNTNNNNNNNPNNEANNEANNEQLHIDLTKYDDILYSKNDNLSPIDGNSPEPLLSSKPKNNVNQFTSNGAFSVDFMPLSFETEVQYKTTMDLKLDNNTQQIKPIPGSLVPTKSKFHDYKPERNILS